MFTGIVSCVGRVVRIKPRAEILTFTIEGDRKLVDKLRLGESVAVNGVCLTVMRKEKKFLEVQVVPETLRSTSLGRLRERSRVNLEPSLKAGDPLGGHFLLGHVDGVGKIAAVRRRAESLTLQVKAPKAIIRYLVPKGAIALDGISLTVQEIHHPFFEVAVIPYTLEHTRLKWTRKGDAVNLEVDLLAKYITRFGSLGARDGTKPVAASRVKPPVLRGRNRLSEDFLKAQGF